MGLIKWNHHYSVDIKEIDEQHKRLIELINQMYDAMRAGQGVDVLGAVLTELVNYTIYHFRTEEQLLEEHDYPELPTHRVYHEELGGKAMNMKKEFDEGEKIPALDVMMFLSNWLNYHILDEDKKYGPFLNSKGVR